ncbi:MAG TPA: AAA family ATPase [Acidimicrobiales bacterium]|nr:AAA family ATPase [Acidimicrobiales bacterium]
MALIRTPGRADDGAVEEFGAYQTHVSRLVFTAERVFKWKRPVRFGFLDFTAPAARRRACEAEVALNRRLAPDVYEGVGEFSWPGGATEPVVVMRRLPDDRRLSTLVRADDPGVVAAVMDVAATLVAFHRRADRGPHVDRDCTADALGRLWETNLEEIRQLGPGIIDPGLLDAAGQAASRYLAGREGLIAGRLIDGRAVDGHGDLMSDDTFVLDDGPRILDCLEFDDRLRHLDVLADAASLAMDLERLGRSDLARIFLGTYRDLSGDDWPDSLAHLHIAYRATVRAKVACIRALELGAVAGAGDARQARILTAQAMDHLRAGAVRMVVVGGLPGTGKTTVAHRLSDATGWPVLSSDVARKLLAGLEPGADATAAFGSGIYSEDMTALVYEELLGEAAGHLSRGRSVIVDASWIRECWRDAAREVARREVADFVPIRCRVPSDLARARIAARSRTQRQASDATPAIHDQMAAALEPWIDALTLDTSQGVEQAVQTALGAMGLLEPAEPDA